MAKIILKDVSVIFPMYSSTNRSLTSKLLSVASGGKLDTDPQGHVLIKALKDINLSLKDGDRLGIVGNNGAGKSTLLRLISGVYHPTSGSRSVIGDISTLIDVGLGIDREATGRENIYVRGALLGLSKSKISSLISQIVEFSELEEFIDLPVRSYSTGMLMRLAFAVATAVQPEILIMDEWLSVGDESFKDKAERKLQDLLSNTKILVIATHSRDLVERQCNKIVWLEDGKIKEYGKPSQILPRYFN